MTMSYFERLQAIEKLIAELKAEQQITSFLERDGAYIRRLSEYEPSSEDTPAVDLDETWDDAKFTEDDHEA